MPPPTLTELQALYYAQIDARTREVLARGYAYSGVTVSLSLDAQIRYEALRNSGLFSSATIESADDTQAPLTLSGLTLGSFIDAVQTYVKGVWDAANTLKASVRASTTIAQVEAVVDTR